jgi:hypothetical protein
MAFVLRRRAWPRDAGHAFGTYVSFQRAEIPLTSDAVADAPITDRARSLGRRPPCETDKRIGAAPSVRVEPDEDGYPNVPIILLDLDVMETTNDSLKELDCEGVIIRRDVDPIP